MLQPKSNKQKRHLKQRIESFDNFDHLGAEAARDVLTKALRRKKGRSDDILRALRYERALVYEDLGQRKRARSELERLYAEAPDYEDVAERLGM